MPIFEGNGIDSLTRKRLQLSGLATVSQGPRRPALCSSLGILSPYRDQTDVTFGLSLLQLAHLKT